MSILDLYIINSLTQIAVSFHLNTKLSISFYLDFYFMFFAFLRLHTGLELTV